MEKLVYVTNYSSTASGPPSLTREGFCEPSLSATDVCAIGNCYDIGQSGTPVPTIKKDDRRMHGVSRYLSRVAEGVDPYRITFLSSLFSFLFPLSTANYSLFNIHYSLFITFSLSSRRTRGRRLRSCCRRTRSSACPQDRRADTAAQRNVRGSCEDTYSP